MSRSRLHSGEFDHNDPEVSSTRSRRGSTTSGRSETVRFLNDRLRLESKSRQETDELYRRLQHEYDDLLARHAQAENTIDQLKIGAKINLYSDAPKPLEASQVKFVEVQGHSPKKLSFPRSNQAALSSDQLSNTQTSYGSIRNYPIAESSVELDFLKGGISEEDRRLRTILKLKELQSDLEAFQAALGDRELDYVQQRNLFQALAAQHEQLKADLLASRAGKTEDESDFTSQRRRFNEEFVTPDSLEGELYRLGLKLEEISDEIGDQLNANDNGNPLHQVLREDFENLKRSQSFGGTQTYSSDSVFKADNIVEEVIRSAPSHGGEEIFSGSEETDFSIKAPNHDDRSMPESHPKSSSLSDPYLKPSCAWEPGVEDLTESGYYPSGSLLNGESKQRSSEIASFYLARSPSFDAKNSENRLPISRPPSVSTKSIGESTARNTPVKLSPSSRDSCESVILRGSVESERGKSRLKDNDSRGTASSRSRSKREGGSIKSKRSSHSISSPGERSDGSDSSSRTTSPLLTSSPRKDIASDSKDLVPLRSQRYLHGRPGSDGRRSNDKGRSGTSRKEASPRNDVKSDRRSRSFVDDPKLADCEGSSSSGRDSPSEIRRRTRVFPQGKHEWTVGKAPSPRPSSVKDSKQDTKGLRPNTADSNVDSGFVGSEDSRPSQKYVPGARNSFGRITPLNGGTPAARKFSSDVMSNGGMQSSRRPSTGPHSSEAALSPRRLSSDVQSNVDMDQARRSHSDVPNSRGTQIEKEPSNLPESRRFSLDHGKPQTNETSPNEKSFLAAPERLRAHTIPSAFRSTSPNRRFSTSSVQSREERPSTGELYRQQLDKLREKMSRRPSLDAQRRSTGDKWQGRRSPALSTVDESTFSHNQGLPLNAPTTGRHNETQTKMTDRESVKSDGYGRYSFELMRDEIQRLRAQLADESRIRGLHTQLVEDLRLRHADYERSSSWKAAEERQKDMLNEIRQRLDKLTDQVQRPNLSFNGDTGLVDQRRLYDEVRGKLDGLSHEIQRSRDRYLLQRDINGRVAGINRIAVCPVCSGTGYHSHGNYVFPRDFVASNSSYRVLPGQDVVSMATSPVPVVTSTPVSRVVQTAKSPLPGYKVVPTDSSTYYTPHNTIHHIHTHHGNQDDSSSSDESSGSEMQKSRRKRRVTRRLKNGNRKWANNELEDFRLHESLDEATKAAREMQRVSKKMLSTIATDLIQVGYDEY